MVTSGARIAVAAASFAALLALVAGGRWAEWTFAAAAVVFPVALSALGASRRGRLGRPLLLPLAGLLTFLAGSFFLLFLLRGHLADGPWIAGVPLAPAVLLVGVWLLPLALVGLAYALDLREPRRGRGRPAAAAGDAATPTDQR